MSNKTRPMRAFRRSLPMSLLRAREAVMKNFVPHLREHDLSPQQWRVLRALYDDGEMEMTALSELCYLLMPSLSRIVQNLEKRELVRRRASDKDLRCSLIVLTASGAELVKIVAPQSEARYDHITDVFGYGKLELLYELLNELTEKLEGDSDNSP
ncbi:homoprotocatechuate degradation operon regulator HpaR [Pseudomaricurvus alcaniphilus]|uniref:homoprotocatechuate degradation operon regulator HpaR n=1 Tax=Pseudomaricurvus alcaniphilus TaxID=1166482 RepID=UPI001409A52E|nr:homoprotocatechuate degradation operon regulator HpaR [Pseudomaricurvus alcaniphilus]NHN39873.1 homoprotocatechuate degradation operon regulator HpaR [Pseudomaricurvus alcaniphilus]